jgi:hypothetical protein
MGTSVKRVRRELNRLRPEVEADRLAAMRVPLWRRLVGVIAPGVVVRWVQDWKRKEDEAERAALKSTAHKVAGRMGK